MKHIQRISLVSCLLYLGACGEPATLPDGEQFYTQTHPAGNSYSCATCHALEEPARDGIVRAGHSLAGAWARPSYKNGQVDRFVDAVNTCLQDWMAVVDPADRYQEDDPEFQALATFLQTNAPGPSTAIQFQKISAPATTPVGNPATGAVLFNRSCAMCHGVNAVGSEQGPALSGNTLDALAIGQRIRESVPQGSSNVYGIGKAGRMPFWGADRLDDNQVRNLIAYVDNIDVELGDTGSSVTSTPRSCTSSHALVGATGTLSTVAHSVAGDVKIVDDCTIRIDNFHYDGGGIVVRVYGGIDGDYTNGFAIGPDIKGTKYEGETLTVQLNPNHTLDDLNGISIWCVTVAGSFGDTLLIP